MFYIRADGNEKIGMGHIMRCLTIAEALRERGEKVCFLTADDKPVKQIEKAGFPVRILFTYYDEMDVELPQLMSLLMADKEQTGTGKSDCAKPKILVDSYFITDFYLKNLRLAATVILMDDNKKEIYPCDALVNYNIYGKTLHYEQEYPADVKLFLGCEYMPLQKQFRNVSYEIRDKVKNILFTTGGGDSCHAALTLAKRLMEKEEKIQNVGESGEALTESPVWHIVCGPFCPDTEEMENLAGESSMLQIHKNVTEMAKLMKSSDIAISAAGSTLYELCGMGIPAIGFIVAENQRQNMEAFSSQTPILNAGDASLSPEKVFAFMEKEIAVLCASKELREKISAAMRTVIDGGGAGRLADGLLKL